MSRRLPVSQFLVDYFRGDTFGYTYQKCDLLKSIFYAESIGVGFGI
jgi:hypothetical protein